MKLTSDGQVEAHVIGDFGQGTFKWEGEKATEQKFFGRALCGALEMTAIISEGQFEVVHGDHICEDEENCCILDFTDELGLGPPTGMVQ